MLIKTLRTEIGLNRKKFAEHFGIPLRTVEDWEAGRRTPPDYVQRLLAYQIKIEILQIADNDPIVKTKRNFDIITDADGNKIVLINDKKFKGMSKEEWKDIEKYLQQYVGSCYEIAESSEKIFIDTDFPDEYANSKERIRLRGANKKAKANASQKIPEFIQIASNPKWEANKEKKHNEDAKYGWYRYVVRFALPIYDEKTNDLLRYNIFKAKMLIRHDADKKKYLYDLTAIKKETGSPLE